MRRELYAADDNVLEAVEQLERSMPCAYLKRHKIQARTAMAAGGLIYIKNRYGKYCVFIPASEENKVRTEAIRSVHDTPSAGHPGIPWTYQPIGRQCCRQTSQQSCRPLLGYQ